MYSIARQAARERRFDAFAHGLDADREIRLDAFVAPARLQQLIDDVERGHDRDAVEADDLAAVPDLAHLAVQVFRGVEQRRALLGRAGDVILLFEYPHADPTGICRHAPLSIAFSRPIIASTRARTCSFFCISVARSDMRPSSRCRKARFSSRSCMVSV